MLSGCESISTVELTCEALERDSANCASGAFVDQLPFKSSINDVVGLPYALPETKFRVEITATAVPKSKEISTPQTETQVTKSKETDGKSTTEKEVLVTKNTSQKKSKSLCPAYKFEAKITPEHYSDPNARYMLRVGELSPFSNRKMVLAVNDRGLLDTQVQRISEGFVQSALSALIGRGNAALDVDDDQTEAADGEEKADEVEAEDDAGERLIRVLAEMGNAESAALAAIEFQTAELAQSMPNATRVLNSDTPMIVTHCAPYADAGNASCLNAEFQLRSPTSEKCSNSYTAKLKIEPVSNVSPLSVEPNMNNRAGRGRILYRIYRQEVFQLTLTTTFQGDPHYTKVQSSTVPITMVDKSNNYAVQATDGLISGTGLRAAFVDGQLVGLSMDRPSPIVSVVTAPFEVIGAVASIPAIVAAD